MPWIVKGRRYGTFEYQQFGHQYASEEKAEAHMEKCIRIDVRTGNAGKFVYHVEEVTNEQG